VAGTPHILTAKLRDPAERPEALARIRRALTQAGGNVHEAAELLGTNYFAVKRWRDKHPEVDALVREVQYSCGYNPPGVRARKPR
jgi:hypothetical protein